ncbi:Hypothetical predicted protein [Mytilus galloprovincialis]|uniref:SWIM-type domain-containing protein n=1 Tax=Mytilus galloprovincialis TaxID=29158 RepID=A0A8B6GER2_MYTGA|nr:Hypothetical predicted protein [Mytilus galloprovincialis]
MTGKRNARGSPSCAIGMRRRTTSRKEGQAVQNEEITQKKDEMDRQELSRKHRRWDTWRHKDKKKMLKYHQVKLSKSSPVEFKSTQCECKAGNGNCSHCIGLLYVLSHFQKLGLKAVPPFQSKTSMPQVWHLPSRTEGLTPKTVDSLEISKVD